MSTAQSVVDQVGAAQAGETAIVVVNFASHRLIDANLSGLDLPSRVLVVVVDNYSTTAESTAVHDLCRRRGWTLVELAHNAGFGAGVNAGARQAFELGAQCLLLLNPDVIIDVHVIEEMSKQCLAQPTSLVTPRVLTPAGDIWFTGAQVDLRDGQMLGAGGPDETAARPWLSGACLGISKQMYQAVNGLDESYFLYWEDVDLSLRAVDSGGRLVVRDDLAVVHAEGGTQGDRYGRAKSNVYYYYNCRNRLLFATRFFEPVTVLRWMMHTPGASWAILMRGGRRQLVHSAKPLVATTAGSIAGLTLALRAIARPVSRKSRGVLSHDFHMPLAADASAGTEPLRVTVAVLTYLRTDELAEGLPFVLEQARALERDSAGRCGVRVVVVDNDPGGSAADVVARYPAVDYRLESVAGVSAARNRALQAASDSDLIVFIDDDERPHACWLSSLVATQRVSGAAAVAGRVLEAFDDEPEPWIRAGRFFVRPSLPTGTEVQVAGAGNLLLDLRRVREIGLSFDTRFGLSGGEDTLFTAMLRRRGGRLVWCNEAVVTDRVPNSRATREWVLHRAWSHGNTDTLVSLALAESRPERLSARVRAGVRGAARIVGGAARQALGRVTGDDMHDARGRRAVWRGAGMVAGALGLVYQEYARQVTPVVVLESFPESPPRGNPFRVLLSNSLLETADVDLRFFSWRAALFSSYDVFHVHWPEVLLEGRDPVRRLVKHCLFLALMFRLRLSRIPVVRTVHNIALPQGISRREIALLRLAERQTVLWIRINDYTDLPNNAPHATITHGHYRSWYDINMVPEIAPGRVLFFGLIRRYKGVDSLISAFRDTTDLEYSLTVVGKPSTVELAERLRSLASGDDRINLTLRFISDDEIVQNIGQAELVVLPYREMHNSTAVLTALSLGRPVLAPDNDVNRDLKAEVGPAWLYLYSGRLTAFDISNALDALRSDPPGEVPDLSDREWSDVGRDHVRAFRRAVEISKSRRRS